MRSLKLYIIYVVMAVVACAVAIGCVGPIDSKPIVTVTIPPQKYLVEQIAGDNIDVRCLLANGANPETYDPTVTNMMNLDKSIAFLRLGSVGFEEAILDKISSVNRSLPVYNISEGIVPVRGTHHHHHPGSSEKLDDEIDPHKWTSVKNAVVMAGNILDALSEVDPGNAGKYHRNYDRLMAHLDSLDRAIAARIDSAGHRAFVVWHPSLSYFARDYGLVQCVIGGGENKEVSVAELRHAIDDAHEHDARVMFIQDDSERRKLMTVASMLDVDEVEINLLSSDWENQILKIADALVSHE
ncbi:MAG: zinc ABC transporter substrate-binding protein [Lachnoclostridium sp.]|nr:zinc ABC transporter substrate-binding protein [Lachnoclostridium sp.]